MTFLTNKQLKKANYLELTPVRIAQDMTNEDNTLTVLIPKFTSNFAKKHLVHRLQFPFIKLNLDKEGSLTWLAIDGKKTVREIATELAQQLENDCVEKRLISFLTQLFEHKLIKFINITGIRI